MQLDISAREALRAKNAVEIIRCLREDSSDPNIQCKALFVLAYLIDEKENHVLNSDVENFKVQGESFFWDLGFGEK